MHRAYVGMFSRCLVSNEHVPLCTLGSTLSTETRRQNTAAQPLATTEGQRVALMNLGYLTEIRGDSINSGHRWSEKNAEAIGVDGYTSKKKLTMRFDDGLCECSHSGRKPRGPPSSGIV